jgi:hypothetical protein
MPMLPTLAGTSAMGQPLQISLMALTSECFGRLAVGT